MAACQVTGGRRLAIVYLIYIFLLFMSLYLKTIETLPPRLQSLLSSIAQLYQTCSSRIDWLEQEVSAHRSHVTTLQDVCLRDNLAYAPVRLQNFNPIFVRLIL